MDSLKQVHKKPQLQTETDRFRDNRIAILNFYLTPITYKSVAIRSSKIKTWAMLLSRIGYRQQGQNLKVITSYYTQVCSRTNIYQHLESKTMGQAM